MSEKGSVTKNITGSHGNNIVRDDVTEHTSVHGYQLNSDIPVSAQDKYYFHLYKRQKLLTDLSMILHQQEDFHTSITTVFQLIGQNLGYSRIYLFEDYTDGIHTRNTYEWCDLAIPSHKHLYEALSYELFPSLKNQLVQEGIIHLTRKNNIPDDLSMLLSESDIKSLVLLPVYVKSDYCGFVGFDHCIVQTEWLPEDLELLRHISILLSGALERRMIVRRMEDSELRLMLALQLPMEGLWDWNVVTGYVHFSDTWCQMLGYEPNGFEPTASAWKNQVHPDDLPEAMNKLEMHLDNQSTFYESIHRIKTRQGSWKWILDRGMAVQRNEQGQPLRVIGTHTDITIQKKAEEELKKSVDVRNKLFSIIAHDLRGHISNFLPALNILTEDEVLDEELKSEILQGLKKASFNTFNLLENLLNWSRYQTDKIRLRKSIFNINELILHNVELFESYLNQKSITLSIDAGNMYNAFADKDSINLIVRNLISNAVKFTPKGGKIDVSLNVEADKLYLVVKDNGLGIPEEIQQNLFRQDNIQSTYGTEREKGVGLGLMLCKEFAELNGGDVFVRSKPGMGSSFTVVLKAADNQNRPMITSPEKSASESYLRGKKILIIEDEQFNQFFIKTLFKDWKFSCVIRENGKDALELLQNENYDLILLDLELPVMDGFTFMNELRSMINSPIPVFAMSANDDDETIRKAFAHGVDDYIIKPFQPELLYDKVIKTLKSNKKAISDRCREKRSEQQTNKRWSDLARLKKTLGNDTRMLKSMIIKFLEITPAYYQEIIDAFESGNYVALKNSSHKIKSSIELLAQKNIVANIRLINQYASNEQEVHRLEPLVRFFKGSFPLLCKELNKKVSQM
jgi:PAS domain S-box-containing protein